MKISLFLLALPALCQNTGTSPWQVTPPNGLSIPAVIASPIPSVWLANSAVSQWIAPSANQWTGSAPGVYTYSTALSVASPSTCTGQFAADDSGVLKVNGAAVAQTAHAFADWTGFTFSAAAGSNALTVVVTNSGAIASATGLRLEVTCTATPIPPVITPPIVVPPTAPVRNSQTFVFQAQADGTWLGYSAYSQPGFTLVTVNGLVVDNYAVISQGDFMQGQGWPMSLLPNGMVWDKAAVVKGVVVY